MLSGEPDAGNLHVRFDEGRVGRTNCVAFSPTLPVIAFPVLTVKMSVLKDVLWAEC